ncbi:hypothetical protein cyc_03145 [Cyclospora cayetanensis]|uniref:Uncharacterized protein n=1 Tax=Cyclospora cayetanensis TaxID=88456 RepID=A0A1D3D7D8_9EIME|nr:hypothetical protein cyc_03145 [Cyclospora cayetanensis]
MAIVPENQAVIHRRALLAQVTAFSSVLFSSSVNGVSEALASKLSASVGWPVVLSISTDIPPEGFLQLQQSLKQRLLQLKEKQQ